MTHQHPNLTMGRVMAVTRQFDRQAQPSWLPFGEIRKTLAVVSAIARQSVHNSFGQGLSG